MIKFPWIQTNVAKFSMPIDEPEATWVVILLFQNQTLVYHHLDLKSLVDTLTRLIWLTQAMVTISRYFSRKKARTKNYYLEKNVV